MRQCRREKCPVPPSAQQGSCLRVFPRTLPSVCEVDEVAESGARTGFDSVGSWGSGGATTQWRRGCAASTVEGSTSNHE